MTECNSCGACCQPVPLGYTKAEIRMMPRAESDLSTTPDEAAGRAFRVTDQLRMWVLKDLMPITRAEALRLRPSLARTPGQIQRITGEWVDAHYYVCRRFDQDTRRCTDYENRPFTCRDFPPAGMKPESADSLPDTCSYRADYGLAVVEQPVWEKIAFTKKGERVDG